MNCPHCQQKCHQNDVNSNDFVQWFCPNHKDQLDWSVFVSRVGGEMLWEEFILDKFFIVVGHQFNYTSIYVGLIPLLSLNPKNMNEWNNSITINQAIKFDLSQLDKTLNKIKIYSLFS